MRPGIAALLLALAPAARGGEDLLASETIVAREVPGPLDADPGAALWDGIAPLAVALGPQRSIRLHDGRANAELSRRGPTSLSLRAAYDGKDVAVLLEWLDATEDRARPDRIDGYGDAAALELPLRFGAGVRLPYVGMGDEELPVAVYFQRAAEDGTGGREAIGSGFGSLARADLGGARVAMRREGKAGRWRAVFVRPLAAGRVDLRKGLVPVAFAVWDGARLERGGNKSLSGWKLLRLARWPLDPVYVAELGWGRRPGDLGDVARGKQLVQGVCAACHLVGERRSARPGIAPDLSAIGAISTPAYLRASIVTPSAVIVPNPNPAQHQDRGRPADARGAFPAADAFAWSRPDGSGRRISKMPVYGALPEADVAAMVAYLMTLGAAAPGAGSPP